MVGLPGEPNDPPPNPISPNGETLHAAINKNMVYYLRHGKLGYTDGGFQTLNATSLRPDFSIKTPGTLRIGDDILDQSKIIVYNIANSRVTSSQFALDHHIRYHARPGRTDAEDYVITIGKTFNDWIALLAAKKGY